MRLVRRLLPNPRSLRGKIGIAAFMTAFLVLASTTAGYAYWQSSLTATSTLDSADLTLTGTNLTGATFGNNSLASAGGSSLVATGSITATNSTVTTSTKTGAVSVTIGTDGTGNLAGLVTRQVWSTTDPASCVAATAVPAGTAAAVAWTTSTVVTATLAPTKSAYWCVRSTIASRESVAIAGGTRTFNTTVSGTITVGNFTGTATGPATQSTRYIYPSYAPNTTNWQFIRPNFENANYTYCEDVSGAATDSGTIVISYGCKNGGTINQQWKFTQVGSTSYYTIQPRNSTTLRMDNGSSSSAGTGIAVVTASGTPATATNQQWQLQQVSAGVYEFVNAFSGMCLTSPGGSDQNLGQMTQAICAGGTTQQFELSQAFENFTCSATSSAWTFAWTSAANGPYHVQVQGTTTDIAATTGTTATGIALSTSANGGAIAKSTSYNVNFIDANGTLVGTANVARGNGSNNSDYSCTVSDIQ